MSIAPESCWQIRFLYDFWLSSKPWRMHWYWINISAVGNYNWTVRRSPSSSQWHFRQMLENYHNIKNVFLFAFRSQGSLFHFKTHVNKMCSSFDPCALEMTILLLCDMRQKPETRVLLPTVESSSCCLRPQPTRYSATESMALHFFVKEIEMAAFLLLLLSRSRWPINCGVNTMQQHLIFALVFFKL